MHRHMNPGARRSSSQTRACRVGFMGCMEAQPKGQVMTSVSMKEMLQAGVHFGHQSRYWNPKMERYIYGARNKIHIINLEHTVPAFNRALDVVHGMAERKQKILFVD